MSVQVHELKIQPKYLEAIIRGDKTFEIRLNDRNFKVGDRVMLIDGERYIEIRIKFLTDYQQKPDNVVFSFDWIRGGKCGDR
ncbi:DUF3850 domain-containing protein [Thaumasiovibrio subtropicus]|uniref:DUF3850 domain-containing protein n=1 Tax=Thaumasiovibrio subtropicus TaxID=1891207 RepID=UPI000B350FB7|nr:DUF3850 domain-containing protein [Thaumasiovibrio subtropicus]